MASQVTGIDEVNREIQRQMRRIGGQMTEKFTTEVLISIAGHAAARTPIATSALINSQYRRVWPTMRGYAGEIGYGAEYAAYVHEAEGVTKGEPRHPSRLGVTWGPNGEPGFLKKGVEEMLKSDLDGIIKRSYDV